MEVISHQAVWARGLFDMLAEGGVWGVPRSGLIFTRRGDTFVLTSEMPWAPEMEGTITPAELREQQDGEYDQIKRYFEEAGIAVSKEVT